MTAETATRSFLLACRSCPVPQVLPFASAAERGKWASQHTRETGHDSWLVRDHGQIKILFMAGCLDCRDFVTLTGAAGVLDDREFPGGDAVALWLREAAAGMIAPAGTLAGLTAVAADLMAGYKPPLPFGTEDERDRWAGAHSSAFGHVVAKHAEYR
jgi:hypothetical protein